MVVFSLKLIDDLTEVAGFIDQITGPQNAIELLPHELFGAPCAVSVGDRMVLIAQ